VRVRVPPSAPINSVSYLEVEECIGRRSRYWLPREVISGCLSLPQPTRRAAKLRQQAPNEIEPERFAARFSRTCPARSTARCLQVPEAQRYRVRQACFPICFHLRRPKTARPLSAASSMVTGNHLHFGAGYNVILVEMRVHVDEGRPDVTRSDISCRQSSRCCSACRFDRLDPSLKRCLPRLTIAPSARRSRGWRLYNSCAEVNPRVSLLEAGAWPAGKTIGRVGGRRAGRWRRRKPDRPE
jgi:hypothetical protein